MKPSRVTLLLVSLSILAACSDGSSKKKPEPPPVPVTTTKATESDIPVSLRMVGRAEAYESVVLKARIDGQVSEVLFTEG
ncbi:MAG: efflux RND transporter periplasmic adaptor subunit, partial [Betaproteobacteria bacterium]